MADPGVRQPIFHQIHYIYLTEFPFITLYSMTDIAMVRKGTHNYQISPIEGGTIDIWQYKLATPSRARAITCFCTSR
jgi:ABC-type transport system substrate-binding protein